MRTKLVLPRGVSSRSLGTPCGRPRLHVDALDGLLRNLSIVGGVAEHDAKVGMGGGYQRWTSE